jgi:hypothetical protein
MQMLLTQHCTHMPHISMPIFLRRNAVLVALASRDRWNSMVCSSGFGEGSIWTGHRCAWKTVRHCFEKGSASATQSRPFPCSHPANRMTKSPSLYAPDSSGEDALQYAFKVRCGMSASFERMVGCH